MADTARVTGAGLQVLSLEQGTARVTGAGFQVLSLEAGPARVVGIGLQVLSSDAVTASGLKLTGEPVYTRSTAGGRKARVYDPGTSL